MFVMAWVMCVCVVIFVCGCAVLCCRWVTMRAHAGIPKPGICPSPSTFTSTRLPSPTQSRPRLDQKDGRNPNLTNTSFPQPLTNTSFPHPLTTSPLPPHDFTHSPSRLHPLPRLTTTTTTAQPPIPHDPSNPHSGLHIPLQHASHKRNTLLADHVRHAQLMVQDLVDAVERIFLVEDRVEQDAEGPDVLRGAGVGVRGEDFGGCVVFFFFLARLVWGFDLGMGEEKGRREARGGG